MKIKLFLFFFLFTLIPNWAQVKVVQTVHGDDVISEWLAASIHTSIENIKDLEIAYIWYAPDFNWILDVLVIKDSQKNNFQIVVNILFHPEEIIRKCKPLMDIREDTAASWHQWIGVIMGTRIYSLENDPDEVMDLGQRIILDFSSFIKTININERVEAWH